MAEVRWIKIYTDMISNKKIKRIRKLPEGNNIVLIWVFLLAQAGECNKSGALYLTDALPFRVDDLAIEFDFEISIIQLALITLERFSMIEIFDEIIFIKNWNEYQNIEGMDKIREQTRARTAIYREKQKKLLLSDVTCDVTVTQGDAIELELDIELKDTTTTVSKILEQARQEASAATQTLTVADIHTKVFGSFSMTGIMSDFIKRIKDRGYTDAFIIELMLETGECGTKPSIRHMETIAERWMKDGIYTRFENRQRKDNEKIKIVSDRQPRIDKELEQRNAEMAFNQFVSNGGNPSDFRTAANH